MGEPGPANVEKRKDAGTGHGKEGHGFGKAVNRGPPLLVQKQQNRRNQRASVANANPPDEVNDGEAPSYRDIEAPDTRADQHDIGDGIQQD